MVVFEQKWLYSGQSGCIRAKVVVSGQKWMYLANKWLHSGKAVVFVKKWLYSGKSDSIRAKVVVFGKDGFFP